MNMGILERYELTISSNEIKSTDSRFTMDNLTLGDDYKIIDVKFETADGQIINRRLKKFERKISNQTLPRLTCQIFEKQLLALSEEERKKFPIYQYRPSEDMIQGIFSSIEDFKEYRNTLEYLTYKCKNGESLVFYCWNIFSTLIFVKECLNRFGTEGDKFILVYKNKDGENEVMESNSQTMAIEEHIRSYSDLILSSKNIVFREHRELVKPTFLNRLQQILFLTVELVILIAFHRMKSIKLILFNSILHMIILILLKDFVLQRQRIIKLALL